MENKSHLISIVYDFGWESDLSYTYGTPRFIFTGLVTGLEINNKVVIDPVKLFENAFKMKMPGRATITYG